MTGEGEKRKIIFGMSTYEFFLSGLSLYKVNPDTWGQLKSSRPVFVYYNIPSWSYCQIVLVFYENLLIYTEMNVIREIISDRTLLVSVYVITGIAGSQENQTVDKSL